MNKEIVDIQYGSVVRVHQLVDVLPDWQVSKRHGENTARLSPLRFWHVATGRVERAKTIYK